MGDLGESVRFFGWADFGKLHMVLKFLFAQVWVGCQGIRFGILHTFGESVQFFLAGLILGNCTWF